MKFQVYWRYRYETAPFIKWRFSKAKRPPYSRFASFSFGRRVRAPYWANKGAFAALYPRH